MTAIYLIDPAGALAGPISLPVVPGIGVQVPDDAIDLGAELVAPAEGFAWALVNGEPVQMLDRRGLVYQTETGASLEWSTLGDLPEEVTAQPFPGPFYVWRGGAWELDTAAQTQAKAGEVLIDRDSRLRAAQLRIAPLQYAVNLDVASEPEKVALLAWMRYSVDLNRVEQQPGYPLAIEWPALPDVTVTP